jgi:adenylosuccinate synthase
MSSIENIDIVLDARYGDCGKGKVVYDLLNKRGHNLCVKSNGSANAGHSIYRQNNINNTYQKIVLHMLPIGTVKPNVYNLIASDCLIDIEKLKKEIEYLKNLDIDIIGRLFISKACHIITPEAIAYDKANNLVGTTGTGIGPTYANKALRISKRIECDEYREQIESLGIQLVDMRNFWNSDFVKTHIKSVIFEGSQGFELDPNWCKTYPYCTSSCCTLASAINTGIPIKKIRDIIVIAKAYDTYVGTMQFQPTNDETLEHIAIIGKEVGSTTGRKRQCNYLNLDDLKIALQVNNANICIINKVDILNEVNIFKLYHNNELISFANLDNMKNFITREIKNTLPDILLTIYSGSPYDI